MMFKFESCKYLLKDLNEQVSAEHLEGGRAQGNNREYRYRRVEHSHLIFSLLKFIFVSF